jgi:hypothetical protein
MTLPVPKHPDFAEYEVSKMLADFCSPPHLCKQGQHAEPSHCLHPVISTSKGIDALHTLLFCHGTPDPPLPPLQPPVILRLFQLCLFKATYGRLTASIRSLWNLTSPLRFDVLINAEAHRSQVRGLSIRYSSGIHSLDTRDSQLLSQPHDVFQLARQFG